MSDFASDASPETRAALRAALAARSSGRVSIELDPALDGRIELDPCLAEPIESDPTLDVNIELDPSLSDYRLGDLSHPDVITRKRATQPTSDPADIGVPAAVVAVTSAPTASEKSTAEPTLHPPHALVVPGARPADTSNRPPPRADEATGVLAPEESAAPRPLIEEPMFEQRDAYDGAKPVEEEVAMAERTSEAASVANRVEPAQAPSLPEPVVPEPVVPEPVEIRPAADGPATGVALPEASQGDVASPVSAAVPAVSVRPDQDADATDGASAGGGEGTPDASDVFEGVPSRSRHFLALLERDGVLLMPQVMAHLGLVRAKGVGGAIEPIQRIARLIGAEVPFTVDYDPSSGHKRWTWQARPLVGVSPELLEPIPAPPPQPKKPKPKKKADRSQYKRAWKRALAYKKSKRRDARPEGRNPKRPPRPKRIAEGSAPPATERLRPPAGPRDAPETPADRSSRRTSAPAAAESRRRRQDRPMPEVFRRTNRPAPARPAPRRDEVLPRIEQDDRRVRVDERVRPAAARASVPRLERPVTDPPRAETAAASSEAEGASPRRGVRTPEERLPLQRSGAFRRRTVGDTDVPVVVIRRRKR